MNLRIKAITEQYGVEGHPLSDLVGLLHALRLFYYSLHWQSTEYDKHLLFQRLYGCSDDSAVDLDGNIDTLAEKVMSDFSPNMVNEMVVVQGMSSWLSKWATGEDSLQRALAAEDDVQSVIRTAYDSLKAEGTLSLGMDDFLMAMANAHENHQYLLRQYIQG